jgi:hypothetical protein
MCGSEQGCPDGRVDNALRNGNGQKNEQVRTGRQSVDVSSPDDGIDVAIGKDIVEVEPLLFPLADGVPARVGLLRGAGNAIVPPLAAVFVETVMEILDERG